MTDHSTCLEYHIVVATQRSSKDHNCYKEVAYFMLALILYLIGILVCYDTIESKTVTLQQLLLQHRYSIIIPDGKKKMIVAVDEDETIK